MNLVKIGSIATDDLTNVKSFHAYTATANTYSTLRETGTGSGFQVPSGKILLLTRIVIPHRADSDALCYPQVLYGDNDVGLSGSSPTNSIMLIGGGTSAVNSGPFLIGTNSGQGKQLDYPIFLRVPALKYPAVFAQASGMTLYLEGLIISA